MKRCILLLFFVVLSNQVVPVEFRDDAFKINVSYNDALWEKVPGQKYRDRLTLKHLNLAATVNILAYRFNETITANGLVQRRIQSVYDGWQLLSQQDISELQSKKKNISEGIRSIYRKSYLDDDLNEQQWIAGDICFVTDDTLGVVLNISVNHPDTLLEVKNEFNKIYNSIWFGDAKPRINFVLNKSDEWVMDQQNLSRKRFYNANFLLNDTTDLSHKIELAKLFGRTELKTYANHNGEYILDGNTVFYIHPGSYDVKKMTLNLINPELILFQNGFYALQRYPTLKVEKYNNNFNALDTVDGFDQVIGAFIVNESMVIVAPTNIKLVNGGSIEWQLDHDFNIHSMVAHEDRLIIADNANATLQIIDLNGGELLTSLQLSSPNMRENFKDIGMTHSKLLVVTEQDGLINKKIVDLDALTIDDEATSTHNNFELVSITNELIIIKYKNEDNHAVLEALDCNTFASVWAAPFDDYDHTVISTNHVLTMDKDKNLVAFELKTAKKTQAINLHQLLNQNVPTDNMKEVSVLGLVPLKNKLLVIIEQESTHQAAYFR
jgi:hypothetical protein